MAVNINRVVLVGNLTRDPELSHSQAGTAICNFSVALNGREKDASGEWNDRADFFNVVVFGDQAEACSTNLQKGRLVGVEGRLRQDRWKDKDTDKNREKVKVVASNVQFLASRGRDGDESEEWREAKPSSAAPTDDIPYEPTL